MSLAVSEAKGSLSKEMKRVDLENLSMTERITDLPEETGKAVTKSKAICNHGLNPLSQIMNMTGYRY